MCPSHVPGPKHESLHTGYYLEEWDCNTPSDSNEILLAFSSKDKAYQCLLTSLLFLLLAERFFFNRLTGFMSR